MSAGFKIPRVVQTTLKSVCFPNDMIQEVKEVIEGRDCTFSAFVIAAVQNALEQLKEQAETT